MVTRIHGPTQAPDFMHRAESRARNNSEPVQVRTATGISVFLKAGVTLLQRTSILTTLLSHRRTLTQLYLNISSSTVIFKPSIFCKKRWPIRSRCWVALPKTSRIAFSIWARRSTQVSASTSSCCGTGLCPFRSANRTLSARSLSSISTFISRSTPFSWVKALKSKLSGTYGESLPPLSNT